ncbi:MAG: hypothetical protein KGH64_06040 [Candidatus Micrarchaeota archaeon]|nr:hypothetical protein [Candidatus Micrarchaeota archaeon]MDE1834867.1 hypothetical protein [Candidatus Micrarchaeota archaeon]MDE1859324.1 hypothetical protein [Candidatus Micrarchaeota archaeon]
MGSAEQKHISHGYSIWMIPEGKQRRELEGIINGISSKYGTAQFIPHVTLVGSVLKTQQETVKYCIELAKNIKMSRFEFTEIGNSDLFYRSVFIRIKKDPLLQDAYEKAVQAFGLEKKDFMPHLSLLYSDFDQDKRDKIISEIDQVRLKSMGFYTGKLHLFLTEGTAGEWRKVKEFKISQQLV